jgi:hypothetical protein
MRVRPDEVPEPSQRAGAVGVRRSGRGPVAVLVATAGAVRMTGPATAGLAPTAGPVRMTGPVGTAGPVSVAGVTPARLRISHDIQDAWNI